VEIVHIDGGPAHLCRQHADELLARTPGCEILSVLIALA
jgi:hypothetical protein